MTSSLPLFGPVQMQTLVAGVDEAGRGPLAGPVVAAAVILDPDVPIPGLQDSKKLTAARRDLLAVQIRERALAWSVAWCDREEIDTLNILHASMLAMTRAVSGLGCTPVHVVVDGNRCPRVPMSVEAIVRGDSSVAAISAASILAKVERDALMQHLHAQYPQYGFDRHKGYPTALHLARLREHGPSPQHRRSFAPVRAACEACA